MICLLLVTHGSFGETLLETALQIVGSCSGVDCLSNKNSSYRDLFDKLGKTLDNIVENDEVIILVDLHGGSCWNAALSAIRGRKNIRIMSGCNLPMVVAFFTHRDLLSLDELAECMKERGIKGIITP